MLEDQFQFSDFSRRYVHIFVGSAHIVFVTLFRARSCQKRLPAVITRPCQDPWQECTFWIKSRDLGRSSARSHWVNLPVVVRWSLPLEATWVAGWTGAQGPTTIQGDVVFTVY